MVWNKAMWRMGTQLGVWFGIKYFFVSPCFVFPTEVCQLYSSVSTLRSSVAPEQQESRRQITKCGSLAGLPLVLSVREVAMLYSAFDRKLQVLQSACSLCIHLICLSLPECVWWLAWSPKCLFILYKAARWVWCEVALLLLRIHLDCGWLLVIVHMDSKSDLESHLRGFVTMF